MLRLTELKLALDHAESELRLAILRRLKLSTDELIRYTVFRRAWDARKRSSIALTYTLDIELKDDAAVLRRLSGDRNVARSPDMSYHFPTRVSTNLSLRPLVIGTGPCGLFAGLMLAQMGFRPIMLERGKAVRERTKDTWGLWRRTVLNPESNVQFGEGGAGTFSDGKLYSQIKDPRHYGRKVLTEFVKAGAPRGNPLRRQAPHRHFPAGDDGGEACARKINALGGEIRFEQRVADLDVIDDGTRRLRGVRDSRRGEQQCAPTTWCWRWATARATPSRCCTSAACTIEAKPFSIGFRIEHPQSLIDRPRASAPHAGHPLLGAADYRLVHHASNGRSVYSFCMCPGGTVVAAASEPGGVVTNGMSQYSRNERNANAGIVVGITPRGLPGRIRWPASPCSATGTRVRARRRQLRRARPAGGRFPRRAGRRRSSGSVAPSYTPGVRLGDLQRRLPDYAIGRYAKRCRRSRADPGLRHARCGADRRRDAHLLAACEITRGEDCQSLNTRGLYPAGEGAGYAGGILSAAVDGIRVAEAVALDIVAQQ